MAEDNVIPAEKDCNKIPILQNSGMAKKKPAAARIDIRVPEAILQEFREAAEREGHLTLSAWVVYTLRRAAAASVKTSAITSICSGVRLIAFGRPSFFGTAENSKKFFLVKRSDASSCKATICVIPVTESAHPCVL